MGAPRSELQTILAHCLSLGHGAMASHSTAAWLWRLDGFERTPRRLEVSLPLGRFRPRDGLVLHRRRDGLDEGWSMRSGVPTTLLTRTLLDVAAFLDPLKLEQTLDSAARARPGFFLELDEFLSGVDNRGRSGAGELAHLLAIRRGTKATGSPFETSVLQRLREEGLVTPRLQYPVYDPGGADPAAFAVLDFAWPRYMVAVLPDGPTLHNTHSRFSFDAAQRARLTALGWRYIVLTRPQVKDGVWMSALKTLVPRAQLPLL